MRWFWQNEENPNLASLNLQLTPEYTPFQGTVIALLVIILMPVMLVLYPIGKLFLGAFVLAGQVGFYLGDLMFGKRAKGKVYRFQWLRTFIANNVAAHVPHINVRFRKFLYRLTGMKLGKGGFMGQNGFLEDLRSENVVLEDNATISFGVTIVGHGPKRNITKPEDKMVILRKGAYVGAACVLIPGVEIGEHATIGAGSVVSKSIPAGAVAAGAPARVLYYKPGYGPDAENTPAETKNETT
ncbi:MAG: hypothetical protein GX929_00420 [Clostridiales bacterium]|jgi:acetyltransferase-like isoleucine patch superfamily enzyme|nr:hypothetical protein [Clostridiales bacterium]